MTGDTKDQRPEPDCLAGHKRRAALLAATVYAEKYFLSFVFLFLVWHDHLHSLDWVRKAGASGAAFGEAVRHALLLLLNSLIGLTLLLGRRPAAYPRDLKEILVPLFTTFFFLTYSAVPCLPAWLTESLWEPRVPPLLIGASLALGIIGAAIAVWGVLSLGRAFGIFVVVRGVVLGGPYRYVRHPMYLGYLCLCASLVLANLSLAIFALVPVHVSLFVYRARLEEARLSEFSAEYRQYADRTGFLLPRLG